MLDPISRFWRTLLSIFTPIPLYVYEESRGRERRGEVESIWIDPISLGGVFPTTYSVRWEDGEVQSVPTHRFVWAGNRWVTFK